MTSLHRSLSSGCTGKYRRMVTGERAPEAVTAIARELAGFVRAEMTKAAMTRGTVAVGPAPAGPRRCARRDRAVRRLRCT